MTITWPFLFHLIPWFHFAISMIVIVSPAKILNLDAVDTSVHTIPRLLSHTWPLIQQLRKYGMEDLMKLMKMSKDLAKENHKRFKQFRKKHDPSYCLPAVYMFGGAVYQGLDASSLNPADLKFAQERFRILSGLYGVLRPLDLVQPYRLEIGTRLPTDRGTNLYQYWGDIISETLVEDLSQVPGNRVMNLASNEYFKPVRPDILQADICHATFKEMRNGQLKFLSFDAKKARGLLARYIIQNGITDFEAVKNFDLEGYQFNPEGSSDRNFLFIR